MVGPADEDARYGAECQDLVRHLGLDDCLRFTGPVAVDDYLPQLDVVVLTSISEAQPLVILEAGAAGIPSVATDVGACREMIYGSPTENPPLGPGGEVTPLANPTATAQAVARLLADREYWERASRASPSAFAGITMDAPSTARIANLRILARHAGDRGGSLMAGIGFELRKLVERGDLLGLAEGYGYAALAASGPWIFTIRS